MGRYSCKKSYRCINDHWCGFFLLFFNGRQYGFFNVEWEVFPNLPLPEELGWEALEGFLCEKLKLGFESGS